MRPKRKTSSGLAFRDSSNSGLQAHQHSVRLFPKAEGWEHLHITLPSPRTAGEEKTFPRYKAGARAEPVKGEVTH